LWVFHRGDQEIRHLRDLAERRVAVGEEGSGTHAVTLTLLEDNSIDTSSQSIQRLGDRPASEALLRAELDAAFFVASPKAPLVQELLHTESIRLMSFARAAAYTRNHHFLSEITLPEGVIDLKADLPPQDTTLLAATANLVARDDFHPALASLLLQITTKVHRNRGLFEDQDEFPNASNVDFPLFDAARRYYKYGPPLLQRYLSFWTADFIDRMKVMLVPLITLLIPLFRIFPPTYRWQVRKKIYRWYRELQDIDLEQPPQQLADKQEECIQRLDAIEEEVRKVSVPLSYADELYELRLHIGLVRNRLLGRQRE
jgi:hypothetical protein